MTSSTEILAIVHRAIRLLRTCPKHETALDNRYCNLCLLEGLTGRTHRSVNQIMEGCVVPSWERKQL
jgi:hypothetical protein